MPDTQPLITHLVHEADRYGYRLALLPDELFAGDDSVDYGLTLTAYPVITTTGIDIATEVIDDIEAEGIDLARHPVGRLARAVAEDVGVGDLACEDALAAAVGVRTMAVVDALEDHGLDVRQSPWVALTEWVADQYDFTAVYAAQVMADAQVLVKQTDGEG